MENQFTISEAKNKFTAIIHCIEKGPSVKITRRGRPVAVLLSMKEYEVLCQNRIKFWDALEAFREKNLDVEISNPDFENLRDRSSGREVNLR
ncbi:MAG: type II toxin-antitoxin system Phd/YefM family antitoxin [Desulfatirhabdiaceae bacterium]